jgi:hypothetical protein
VQCVWPSRRDSHLPRRKLYVAALRGSSRRNAVEERKKCRKQAQNRCCVRAASEVVSAREISLRSSNIGGEGKTRMQALLKFFSR